MNLLKSENLNRESAQPLFLQIYDILKRYIETPEAKKSGIIPKEHELCQLFEVSRNTVSQSLAMLAEEHLIQRIKRRGTVISSTLNNSDPRTEQRSIGLVFPISRKWNTAINAMEQQAYAADYRFEIYSYSWYDFKDEQRAFAKARKNCAGVILYPNGNGDDRELIQELSRGNYPFVLFDLYFEEINCCAVTTNNLMGGFLLTSELIKSGCKKIACFSHNKHLISSKRRLEGYEKALKVHNLTVDEKLKIELFDTAGEYQQISNILQTEGVDGIFCTRFFGEILNQMQNLNLNLPIAKYDNDILFESPRTVIFSAEQSEAKIGLEAARLLCAKISNPTEANKQIMLSPDIIKIN